MDREPGRLRILHAIHDFLPRHRAGSEIYVYELCRALARHHDVAVLCAEFDPGRAHAALEERAYGGVRVIEIVNNWRCTTFEETYRPPAINRRIEEVLETEAPHVVHVHNLLNLSFELPALARARGIPVVATLHDYALVCASGGQRLHRAQNHLCRTIDPVRCSTCFRESPFQAQMAFAGMANQGGLLSKAGASVARRMPTAAGTLAGIAARVGGRGPSPEAIQMRLAAARAVLDAFDAVVAPSRSIALEFEAFGLDPEKVRVAPYGSAPLKPVPRTARRRPLRIGYVGTLAWHKGIHVLVDAVRGLDPSTYEVHIHGDPAADPAYARALREQATGLPVLFAGPFDRDRVGPAYASIDLLVVPSLWLENWPLVVQEAFANGVPVVAARIGGLSDAVRDGIDGLLFEPDSSDGLRSILADLVRRPERVDELAASAPPLRSIDDDADSWSEIYRSVIQPRRPA